MRHGSTLAGLVLIASALTAGARGEDVRELPTSMLGLRVAPMLLLSRPDVRSDLALNADQEASAERALDRFLKEAQALRGKPNKEETIRARRAVDDEALGWIQSRLTPEQRVRLIEIDLQWEGPSALVSRPNVAKTLALREDQIRALRGAVQRRDQDRSKGVKDADRQLAVFALSALDAEQRESWKAMLGREMTFR